MTAAPGTVGEYTLSDDERQAIQACSTLVRRTGAQQFQIGFQHEGVPVEQMGWWAFAVYQGNRVGVQDKPGPGAAADALAQGLLTGAKCVCGRLTTVSPDGAMFAGTAREPARMLDGTTWSLADARSAGQCLWQRKANVWVAGCAADPQRSPLPPWSDIPVEEQSCTRLAAALVEAEAPDWLVSRARKGWYDEYRSPLPLPPLELVVDLRRAAAAFREHGNAGGAEKLENLVQQVVDGKFDATAAEADAWKASDDGQAAFAALMPAAPAPVKRATWTTPQPGAKPQRGKR